MKAIVKMEGSAKLVARRIDALRTTLREDMGYGVEFEFHVDLYKDDPDEDEEEIDDETKIDPSEPLISWDELRECKADYDHETGAPRVFFGSLSVHASTASELADRIKEQVRMAVKMESKA